MPVDSALVMVREGQPPRLFVLAKEVTVIGRKEDCDLRIPLSEISRRHCKLVKTGMGLRVEDMGSSNGTLVNGQRVNEIDLEPGDRLTVGSMSFVVQIDGDPPVEEVSPAGS
jgi:pSer/pThr/pTyr-binding forkhead associated (FHA) protein